MHMLGDKEQETISPYLPGQRQERLQQPLRGVSLACLPSAGIGLDAVGLVYKMYIARQLVCTHIVFEHSCLPNTVYSKPPGVVLVSSKRAIDCTRRKSLLGGTASTGSGNERKAVKNDRTNNEHRCDRQDSCKLKMH